MLTVNVSKQYIWKYKAANIKNNLLVPQKTMEIFKHTSGEKGWWSLNRSDALV